MQTQKQKQITALLNNNDSPHQYYLNIQNLDRNLRRPKLLMPSTVKRKKSADMPDSPPKRVTRARAKASNDGDSKVKTVRIMTPSTKVIKEKKEAIELGRAVKRKTRADDEQEEPTDDPKELAKIDAAKPRARTKKSEQLTRDETKKAEDVGATKKTRGRPPKTNLVDEVKAEAPKLRTRARKTPKPEEVVTKPNGLEDEGPGPVRKTVRTRAATGTTKIFASTTSSLPKSLAPKKKVKFEEDARDDKENMPVKLDKSAPKATGLRAKPIRKPAPTQRTARAKRAAAGKTDSNCGPQVDSAIPLSPKKVKQVAKSSSIGSEDELCGERTPKRALSQSPVKQPPSTVRKSDIIATKLDFHAGNSPSSPTKSISATVLQSPARRPPLSPFKDALKKSPRKGNLGDPFVQPALVASQSPLKSTLKSSPKRGLAPLSLKPSLFSQTPLKASLLQSPARRPGGSPVRSTATASPSRASDMVISGSSVTPSSSPQEACSSPLRLARTPGQYKVHTINKTEIETGPESTSPDPIGQDFATSWAGMSPGVVNSQSDVYTGAEENAMIKEKSVNYSIQEPIRESTPATFEEGAVNVSELRRTTAPGPFTFAAPAFSLASPIFRCSVDESDSEDELASPQKVFLSTPLLNQGISLNESDIQGVDLSLYSNKPLPSSSEGRNLIAMTPLAAQMSAWLASSPEQKTAAATMGPGQVMSQPVSISTHDSPPKASFFEDQMAVLEVQNESLVDIQTGDSEHGLGPVQSSQDSQASEEYGDENTMPVDPQLVGIDNLSQDLTVTCTPAKVFYTQPREICTVSKVPLRPAADDTPSPLKVSRKRSKSLAGSSTFTFGHRRAGTSTLAVPPLNEQGLVSDDVFDGSSGLTPVKHWPGNDDSLIETPRTLRKNAPSSVLKGAVVFVDVHTTEGEDASGIFLELLAQMGARCVRQWSWNPRTSVAATVQRPVDSEDDTTEAEASNHKVGITHVVYKDGGKRTMEKVRASKGAVHCVGVGWVLE